MSEKMFKLPDSPAGSGVWTPRMSTVVAAGGSDGAEVLLVSTLWGDQFYPAAHVREFALALLAAADASEETP